MASLEVANNPIKLFFIEKTSHKTYSWENTHQVRHIFVRIFTTIISCWSWAEVISQMAPIIFRYHDWKLIVKWKDAWNHCNCSILNHIGCVWIFQARIYTPKNVFQELEVAKEEYIRTAFRLHKGQKVLLPKLVESFSKESGLCQADLVEIIEHCMPNSLGKGIHWGQHGKFWKSIEWTPHNFAFRYLLSRELPKWFHALIYAWDPQGDNENNSLGEFKWVGFIYKNHHWIFWRKHTNNSDTRVEIMFLRRTVIKQAQAHWAWAYKLLWIWLECSCDMLEHTLDLVWSPVFLEGHGCYLAVIPLCSTWNCTTFHAQKQNQSTGDGWWLEWLYIFSLLKTSYFFILLL